MGGRAVMKGREFLRTVTMRIIKPSFVDMIEIQKFLNLAIFAFERS